MKQAFKRAIDDSCRLAITVFALHNSRMSRKDIGRTDRLYTARWQGAPITEGDASRLATSNLLRPSSTRIASEEHESNVVVLVEQ